LQLLGAKNMVDLSIVIPAIRPNYWKRVYETVQAACAKHSFEIIFVSPHKPIDELMNKVEIKHVLSYSSPVRCQQLGALYAEGRLICFPTDDGEFSPDSFDVSIDLWDSMQNEKALIAMRYREGRDMTGISLPREYFSFGFHDDLRVLSIPGNFIASGQPMLGTKYFCEIGGMDCRFEHVAMGNLDICARLQFDGGPAAWSPLEVMSAYWSPGVEGDHAPVHNACMQNDSPLFKNLYTAPIKQPIRIDFNNWKLAPSVWPRRWPNGIK
jgi:hypothetical protein